MERKGTHYFAVLNEAPSPVSIPVDIDIKIDNIDIRVEYT